MEEKGGPGGPRPPPTFFAGGPGPPHFSVENKGIIKKEFINAAVGFGTSGRGMAGPPHFKLCSSIYVQRSLGPASSSMLNIQEA